MKLTEDTDKADNGITEKRASNDMLDDEIESIYVGGSAGAWAMFNQRRAPATGKGRLGFPAGNCDLDALRDTIVTPASPYRFSICLDNAENESALLDKLSVRSEGKTELELLHLFCIANLRRRSPLPEAKILFHRIWEEQLDFMVSSVEPRWFISAMATFADHGKNEYQRIIGASFNIFFSMMKLYEFERLTSRPKPGTKYANRTSDDQMPLDLPGYAFSNGDLDVNTIARLHQMCEKDQVAGFLGQVLLYRTLGDQNTIFARLAKVKKSPIFAKLLGRDEAAPEPDAGVNL